MIEAILIFKPYLLYQTDLTNSDREFWQLLIKIMIPATIAICFKIAIQNHHQKISKSGIAASIICGLGLAYLSGKAIMHYIDDTWIGLVAGAVAILAEHIVKIVLYRLKWDVLGDALFETLKNWILRKAK